MAEKVKRTVGFNGHSSYKVNLWIIAARFAAATVLYLYAVPASDGKTFLGTIGGTRSLNMASDGMVGQTVLTMLVITVSGNPLEREVG